MTPENKASWIAALRGGEYKQDKGSLYTGRGHCCLGVYCKHVAGIPVNTLRRDLQSSYDATGIKSDKRATLIAMNDDGKSFAEIADWIEQNIYE
jgi:hypothetical protein